ncbi:SusC/RagA family TonB-linked outer membrane protein [Arachidicoccus sp.]|uniref:SusC/RagA family TonB-linked outer membrane protein n=1 Tax=Arachidicoccus sp. TaxID=1872624 RepID=UPI003D1BE364
MQFKAVFGIGTHKIIVSHLSRRLQTFVFDLHKTRQIKRSLLLKKALLAMKLTTFLLIAFMLSASAKVTSQVITFSAKSATLDKIFNAIERQTGYVVFCDYQFMKDAKPLTLSVKSEPLTSFLDRILKSDGLNYAIEDKTIIVSRAKKKAADNYNLHPIVSVADRHLKGRVLNENGLPMVGVVVTVKGTKNSVVTDADGIFDIVTPTSSAILVFSNVGYEIKEAELKENESRTIRLLPKIQNLDSVIVVGYGTQKKVDLTGAVATISGDELVNRPVPNALAALQGALPGITVTRSSGQPGGEGYSLRIRGFSSANATDPLVLIDGLEGDLTLLNPDDIASISILKDAAAAAIYGARAAAGVVLVTTKKGNIGQTRINFNSYYGVDITARQPQRLNSWDEQTLIDEARFNATGKKEFTDEQDQWLANPNFDYRPNISGQDRWDYYDNINWVQEGMNKYNPSQNYSLSVSQGDKKLNYLLSAGYYSRQGILKYGPDGNDRYNLRLNINSEINKYVDLSVRASYAGSFIKQNSYGDGNIVERLYRIRTRQSLYVPAEDTTGAIYNGDLQVNPVDIEKNSGETDNNYEVFNGQANLKIHDLIKGLTLNIVAGRAQDYYNSQTEKRSLYWYGRSTNTIRFSANVPNSLSKTKNKGYDNNLQAYLNYALSINEKHHFKLLVGTSYEDYRKDEFSASATSMITNDFFSFNYADLLTKTNADSIKTWAMGSYFGRLNYDYKEKYLFEANLRVDGSSRLAPENRWGAFPSFSAGWNIKKEGFMQDRLNFISSLKLRASWGQLGNGAVLGLYDYIPLLSSGTALDFNDQKAQYIYQNTLASPSKTWEIVQTSDVGLDMGFIKNHLNVTADYYIKKNKNMLATLQVPSIIGVNVSSSNVGELKSWGWEFDAQWKDNFRNGSYSVAFNISDNQNKLIKYDGQNSIGAGGTVKLLEGYPLNTIWGYKTDGYYQQPGDYAAYGVQSFNDANVGPGDVKYLDLDGNKKIDAGGGTPEDPGDLVNLGTTNARYTFGLNLGVNWKNFDLSLFLQGTGKRSFLIDASTLNPLNATSNLPWSIMMDRWTPDNRNALFPREYQSSNFDFEPSDKWVQNGSYIRLKNIQFGYSIPINKKYIQRLRIYFSGQDLWESTKVLPVFDPEVPDGVSASAYPFYRVVAFGLNLTF